VAYKKGLNNRDANSIRAQLWEAVDREVWLIAKQASRMLAGASAYVDMKTRDRLIRAGEKPRRRS